MNRKSLLALAGVGILCLFVGSLVPAWIGPNFHAVVPGRVYRSGQLSQEELVGRVQQHGLRTVINLRGDKEDRDWYQKERTVAEQHDLVLRSLDLIPERLPPRPLVVALIDFFENLPEPILVHCAAGADRAGFASVLAKMALGGARLEEARSELSLRYGHIPFGPSAEIGRIYDLYEEHLERTGEEDCWERFERWARESYVPYVYSARLEAFGFPSQATAGERMDVRLRITNTSPGPWLFSSDLDRGIKIGIRLRQEGTPDHWLDYDRHGQFDASLGVGEQLELEVPIWAPRTAGRYWLKLDMVDEHVTWFEDQGSSPLHLPLSVRAGNGSTVSESESSF